MIVSRDQNITTITQEKLSVVELVQAIETKNDQFKNDNLIVHLTQLDELHVEELLEFLKLSNEHRANKHSFVIISNTMDIDEVPDEIIVVPTLQEAFDVVEMEEMERDLGF